LSWLVGVENQMEFVEIKYDMHETSWNHHEAYKIQEWE